MDNYIHKILDSFIIMNTGERERERDKIEVGIKKTAISLAIPLCTFAPAWFHPDRGQSETVNGCAKT